MSFRFLCVAAFFLTAVTVLASETDKGGSLPAAIVASVADEHRPAEQTQLDAQRKPVQMLLFAGVKPGERIADFMPGNAYFTRILSKAVGPHGKVYAFLPAEQLKNCPPAEVAGARAITLDPAYRNVKTMSAPVNEFATPQPVNILWTTQNYHDLHDSFMGPANIEVLNKRFFKAVKPGGVFIVIDHAAAAGSGLRDTETLHRIDPLALRREIEAAGFIFEAQDNNLENTADDHSRTVFDPLVRGKTDQFVYKFRKPEPAQ
jgi:predicted methyltransferase